jgi:hypothetical protein
MRQLLFSLASLSSIYLGAPPRRALSQHVAAPHRTVTPDSCLPSAEFQLRGVTLTSLSSEAFGILGKPVRVTTDSGEDDGGRYQVQTYHYLDLDFDDVRGFVDRLATRSPAVATPSGVRPGLTFAVVRDLVSRHGVELVQPADTIDIRGCELDASMIVAFDPARRVRAVVMAAARP